MSREIEVQGVVHELEEGSWRKWVQWALLGSAVAAVLTLWFFGTSGFRGLAHPMAFEQAEIARELARGHGFSTKLMRPVAIDQLRMHTGTFPETRMPDLYQAPLWPGVLAPFLWLARGTWTMTEKDLSYPSDKVIAALGTAFFLLAAAVNYFLAKRLFDRRLAVLGLAFVLLCDRCWQFSMTGLPQMLLLFLLSSAAYALLRAVEAALKTDVAGKPRGEGWRKEEWRWLALAGVLFGLLALGHAGTLWILLGAVVFVGCFFEQRGFAVAVLLLCAGTVYAPWLIRNCCVLGSIDGIGGLGIYSFLTEMRGTEGAIMRASTATFNNLGVMAFPKKAIGQMHEQLSMLYGYLGCALPAPVFFLALLHPFKRREIAVFRWAVLAMWIGGFLGMALLGMDDQPLKANDLHILFMPLMTLYGLAFILMLWSRMAISAIPLVNAGFMALLLGVSAFPFCGTVAGMLGMPQAKERWPFHWPPYVPPYIAILGHWTKEEEIIASDMPWAVAWYADRRSLWLPATVADFNDLNDYLFGGRIVCLHLTPVSGNRAFLDDIADGDFKSWEPFIARTVNMKNFPLHAVTALPLEQKCIVFFDRDRWSLHDE